jgi:hypothetical protein
MPVPGYWNCCDRVSAALPWSGRKHSGFGATLSHAGLRAFTKTEGISFAELGTFIFQALLPFSYIFDALIHVLN